LGEPDSLEGEAALFFGEPLGALVSLMLLLLLFSLPSSFLASEGVAMPRLENMKILENSGEKKTKSNNQP
jgi:hypothetical protein